jgi:ribose transport system substrate-binding protein
MMAARLDHSVRASGRQPSLCSLTRRDFNPSSTLAKGFAMRVAFFASITAAFTLVSLGCTSSQPTNNSSGTGGAGGEKPTVAFVSNNAFEFWTFARRGTEKGAKEFNVEVNFQMPAPGTAAKQREIVEDLMAKGVKGIAISPNDAENQAEFLNGIADQVPIITQDSDLPPGSKRLCYIGTNNYDAGKAAGQLVKEALPEGGKIVVYVGKLDAQNAVERRQGLMDELAGAKDAKGPTLDKYELLDTMTDDAKQEKCKANVEDTLTKYPDVACLVGLWAYNPPAILAAVKEAGKQGKVAIVGFDENDETLQGIDDGHIHGTIVQQPFEFGYQSVRILASLARGDRSVVPANGILYIPHRVIKKDNVAAFRAELTQLKSG